MTSDEYAGLSMYEALAVMQAKAPVITKTETVDTTREGGKMKYNFAGLNTVWAAIGDLMDALGFVWTTRPDLRDLGSGQTRLVLECTLYHLPTKDFLTATYPLKGERPQEIGSGMTYGRRYALVSLLNLRVAEDDDDAQKAEEEAQLTPSQQAQGGARKSAQRTQRPARPRSAPPPVEEAPATPEAANPQGPMSEATRRKLFATLKELGYADREDYLRFVNRTLARNQAGPVGSSNDLTQEQAGWVIEAAEAEPEPPTDAGQPAEGEG